MTSQAANPMDKTAIQERLPGGWTLSQWQENARRDDCLECMVPSDLRQFLGTIDRLTSERDAARAKAIEEMRPLIETVALEAMKPYGEELTRGQIQMLSDVIARETVSRALNGGVK